MGSNNNDCWRYEISFSRQSMCKANFDVHNMWSMIILEQIIVQWRYSSETCRCLKSRYNSPLIKFGRHVRHNKDGNIFGSTTGKV